MASSMSCVTNRIVFCSSRCSESSSSCSELRTTGSTALNGSSISSTGGAAGGARAPPPPRSWPPPAVEHRDSGDVVLDGPVREQPGLLDHVADAAPQPGRVLLPDVLAVERDP